MTQGAVKRFMADKGYGFIAPTTARRTSSSANPPSRLTATAASRTANESSTPSPGPQGPAGRAGPPDLRTSVAHAKALPACHSVEGLSLAGVSR